MDPLEYVQSGKHLSEPLRDFHDQKDLFKLMHRTYGRESEGRFQNHDDAVDWVTGQCYVIDWFLWFMAQRGYTLQASRAKVEFRDIYAEIEQMKNEDAEAFKEALNAHRQAAKEHPTP